MPRRAHRLAAAAGLVAGSFAALVLGAAPAWAHLDPTLGAIPAGESTPVGFTVEHGCDDSPTTSVAVKIPGGLDDVSAEAKSGWHVTSAGGVVTWEAQPGEELPAHDEGVFTLDLNPSLDAVGDTLVFKTIQTCEEGEIRWIEVWDGQGEEPEHPAPAIEVEPAGEPPATTPPDEGGGDEGTGGGDHVTTTVAGGAGGDHHHGDAADDHAEEGGDETADDTTTTEAAPDTTTTLATVDGDEAAATSLSGSADTDDASVALVVLVIGALGFAGIAIYRHRKAG